MEVQTYILFVRGVRKKLLLYTKGGKHSFAANARELYITLNSVSTNSFRITNNSRASFFNLLSGRGAEMYPYPQNILEYL